MLTLVAFIAALAILIVFHEFGHYLVARLCGVKVLRFSLGFGRALYTKQFAPGGTEWVLAAFPLGGYVKMLGEQDEVVSPEEQAQAFNRQSVLRRFLIVAAGPIANFLLAILLYWGLYLHGIPGQRALLDSPLPNTAAARAGITHWDMIETLDGQVAQTWEDVNWYLAKKLVEGGKIDIGVRNISGDIAIKTLSLQGVNGNDLDKDFLQKLGLQGAKTFPASVGKIMPESAAQRAGLQAGDLIMAVAGVATPDWNQFSAAIRERADRATSLSVLRQKHPISLIVTPSAVRVQGKTIGQIGIQPNIIVTRQYPLFSALAHGAAKTWDTSVFTLKMLGRMLVGDVSWRNLSGPITIAQVAGEAAHIGWLPYLLLIALVSVSLGVLNLLPVPILDGGHLMYYVIEALKGSPVSPRIMEVGQRFGLAVLMLLMTVALYNDIVRQVGQ